MAGTDSTKKQALWKLRSPAIILVEPQLGENIGFAARAMLNCGLGDLRIIRPRDGWPNPKAKAAASGADQLIDRARIFDTIAAASAGFQHLYATTARLREKVKPVLTPRRAAEDMRERTAKGERIGILFGPERAGLENDHVSLADAIIQTPLNPAFASLNLGHAVLIVGYEWWQAGSNVPPAYTPLGKSPRASRSQLMGLFEHLERELVACGFLRNEEKQPSMMRNIRNALERAELTAQEVRTFRGIVANLVEPKPERVGRRSRRSATSRRAK